MTKNLYRYSVPSIKSLLANSDVDEIYLLIEDDEFPYDLPKLKVINVSDQKYIRKDTLNGRNTLFTYMAMMRACLCKYIKANRCLSLDCDTIIDGDISELWELPPDDYYLAAGREPHKSQTHGSLYVNVGVTIYNLKKLRDGKADEVINALNTRNFSFIEQDAFNELCRGQIYEMDPKYNVHYWSVPTAEKPVITHYAGQNVKSWFSRELVQKYDKMEV